MSLVIMFNVTKFVLNPALGIETINYARKIDFIEIAGKLGLPVKAYLRKAAICDMIIHHYISTNVLGEEAKDYLSSEISSVGLTVEQKLELEASLAITVEREKAQLALQQEQEKAQLAAQLATQQAQLAAQQEKEKYEMERTRMELEASLAIKVEEEKAKIINVNVPPFGLAKNIKLVPPFLDFDPDDYFRVFEETANHLKWPREQWVWLLKPKLTGKAAKSVRHLENTSDYEAVKQAILDAFSITEEGYRQAFRDLTKKSVTLPPWERYLNWIHDPAPPPTRYHGDLTSAAPSENQENMLPQDSARKLPRRLWPCWRKQKQPESSTNGNSATRVAGPATQPGSSANRNSAFQEAKAATRPRSTANRNSPPPGNWPGTSRSNRSTPVEHPRTFLRPQHPQHPRFWTNQNSGRQFDPDHPEFRGVYKPAQPSIQQDSAHRLRRDSFSGSGLSSPALQRSHRDSFSESPPGQLNKEISLTDSNREARITEGSRPGIVYPLPRAARPDTWLEVDAATPEAAALSRAERPPTVLDIPET